jgi:hypothetical protein
MSKKITAISDMEEERFQNENRLFKISNLKIMLDLTPTSKNRDANIVPFTFDMYFHPDFEKDAPATTSKFPVFTNEAQYPYLQSKSLKERVEFFFNIQKFTEEIRANGSNWVESLNQDTDVDARNAQLIENEKANIASMLRAIFPISEQFGNVLSSSYDNHILQNMNWEVVYGIDAMELANIFGFAERFGFMKKDRNSSYLKINGTPKTIFSVTWENDVVNHPVYRKFIETYINQLKRTKMNQYEFANDVALKKDALNLKLVESWDKYSVKDQVYKKYLPKLLNILGMSADNSDLYKVEKKLNQISESELVKKWSEAGMLDGMQIKNKMKNVMTKLRAVNAFKQSKPTDGTDESKMTPEDIAKALKDVNSIGSLIHYLEGQLSSNDYDEYGRRRSSSKERDIIQRIIFKLTSLNSENGAKGLAAANTLSEVYDMITENNISLGEYSKLFKEYLNLAVDVQLANRVYLFVSETTPIPIAKNGVFIDGTKETETDKLIGRKMREGDYVAILKQSEELSNSVENVYVPKRKTSNVVLFDLIERIRGKQKKNKPQNVSDDKFRREEKAKQLVFEKVFRKYLAKNPMNYPLAELKQYMYTGVDTTIKPPQSREESSEEKKKTEEPGISEEFSEIYVRIDFVDKMNYDNTPIAQCKLKDDVLKNELHYLLDMNSLSDLNPFRDYRLAEEYGDKTPEPEKKKGGRSRRIKAVKSTRRTRQNR